MLLIKKHWRLLVGACVTLLSLPASFMTIDAYCSPISNEFCRQWLDFQWETMLAGLWGLGGGYLALVAVKWQDRNQQLRTMETCRNDLKELRTLIEGAKIHHKNITEELRDALEICRAELRGDAVAPRVAHVVELARQNTPEEINKLINDLVTIQDTVKQITFDFRTVLSLIKRVGLNQHIKAIPVKAYQTAYAKIVDFPDIYFATGSTLRPLKERQTMTIEQLSFMHSTVSRHTLGSMAPATWQINGMIKQIDEQIIVLKRPI